MKVFRRTRKRPLTKKQQAQRKYAARMHGIRSRAARREGGRGPISQRGPAKRLRKALGLKA